MLPNKKGYSLLIVVLFVSIIISFSVTGYLLLNSKLIKPLPLKTPVNNTTNNLPSSVITAKPLEKSASGAGKVKVELTRQLNTKNPDVVYCKSEGVELVKSAALRNNNAILNIQKCSTDTCMQDLTLATDNLLKLIEIYCK